MEVRIMCARMMLKSLLFCVVAQYNRLVCYQLLGQLISPIFNGQFAQDV
jgi:hypothetical protein